MSPQHTPADPCLLNFGGYELPEEDSQAHFQFVGTTGSGKTLGMRLLMQSTLSRVGAGEGYRGLVYDAKQDALPLLSAFCDRDRLFTLNPFDDRGVAWDIARDINEPRVALEIAFTLIPEASESQPYFANASRHIIYGVIASYMLSKHDWTLADLLRAVGDSKLCRRVLERHPQTSGIVTKYFQDERLLNDIMSTLATKLLVYEAIAGCWEAAKRRISLHEWAESEMILILGNSEISRIAIDNLNRCVFKRAADIILMKPELTTERSWFYIDEVSEARKLNLPPLVKKGRSKGARVAMAFQSISGLRDPHMYGTYTTDDILGQVGNRFFGRIECPETAEWASRVIGDQEIFQESTSRSFSSQGSSRTTNLTPVVRRAALASEFMSVPPCNRANGLTGLFTTRSTLPTWSNLSADVLFDELLIPPAADVQESVPRDPLLQFVLPWSAKRERVMAPKLKRDNPRQNPPIDDDLGQDLDDFHP